VIITRSFCITPYTIYVRSGAGYFENVARMISCICLSFFNLFNVLRCCADKRYDRMSSISQVLVISALLRILLILYGCYHDAQHVVKYTDIDYQVFTEAATFVSEGGSPYQSLTYRYTPILALILLPNVHLHILWGKVLFSFFDLVTGYLLHVILRFDGWSTSTSTRAACLWLFNPVAFTVSTRGNAEAILSALVLTVLLLAKRGNTHLSALLYGLAVHMKIYPIVYSLPLYLFLGSHDAFHDSSLTLKNLKTFFQNLIPNKKQLIFVSLSILSFLAITAICYWFYGQPFLHQTYLYHISRKDIRHNFSVYYLMFYLMAESDYLPLLSLLAFLPQALLLLKSSFSFFRHLEFVFFVNTAIFVTFNKVVTSQYFLWYLCLLPLLAPYLKIKRSESAVLTLLWSGNQAAWLLAAYYLEFLGKPTYVYIFIASIAFFLSNCHIIRRLTRTFNPKSPKSDSAAKCD